MGLCLNLSLASKITHLLVSYVVCPITTLVKNSYFISDIIPIFFFTIRYTFTALFLSNTKARPRLEPTALRNFFFSFNTGN